MPEVLSPNGLVRLESLQPFLQNDTDIQGVVDVLSRETDRLDAAKDEVFDNFFPHKAADYLHLWELLLGLPVMPADYTVSQRRVSVVAYLQSLASSGSGLSWEDELSKLIGTGWDYEEHDPDDPGSPDENVIRITVPFSSAVLEPTGLTATPGTPGTLATGTYHYRVSAVNAFGETTACPAVSATLGATGRATLAWPDVAGATSYRIYRGASAGTTKRIATVMTSDWIDDGSVSPTTIDPPTVNSTRSLQAAEAERMARKITPAHLDLEFGYSQGFIVGISLIGEEAL